MNNDKKSLKSDMNIFLKSLKLIWNMDPRYIPMVVGHSILTTAGYFVSLVMSAFILDELIGTQDIMRLAIYVGILIGASFGLKLLSDLIERLREGKDRTLQHTLYSIISKKILTLDYQYIDSPKLHDLRQKILEYDNINGTTYTITTHIRNTITSIIEIVVSISLAIALFTPVQGMMTSTLATVLNSPFWAIPIFGVIIMVVIVQMRASKKFGAFQMELYGFILDVNRIGIYFMYTLLGNYKNGKDMRMYKNTKMLSKAQDRINDGFLGYTKKMAKEKTKIDGMGVIANGLFIGLIYVFVVLKAFVGAISIGSIMKYVGTIQKLSSGISGLLVGVTEIRVNCQFLRFIHELLELPNIMYHGTLPVEKREDHEYDVEFKDVSFKYPGSEEYVLRNVSLKLHIGERLAVVGMNGAGKTTMIKLLCRLYDPTEGTIYLNGIDIKKYDYNEYLSLFSVVFQDFNLFSFPVDQNIATSADVDNKWLGKCLESAGVNDAVMNKKKGASTFIGKDFSKDGVDFSGGEMQKIAIARALYKNASIIILDEPTAALDPISEFEIYSRFDTLIGNKTAIYISHRLSSCRFCNDIVVFHEGEIVQRGSHDELIKYEGSKYHEMWNAQAQYYEEETEEIAV